MEYFIIDSTFMGNNDNIFSQIGHALYEEKQ